MLWGPVKMKKALLILTCIFLWRTVYAEQEVFYTWEGLEADKLASIWLIKRFIAPGARVIFCPKGEIMKEGTAFDTPYSDIARKFDKSTFESLLEHYALTDQKLVNIGKLIHDIEINLWEEKVFRQSKEIEIMVVDLLNTGKSSEQIIDEAVGYFDRLYSELPKVLDRHGP